VHDLRARVDDDGRVFMTVFRNDQETERLRQLDKERPAPYLTDAQPTRPRMSNRAQRRAQRAADRDDNTLRDGERLRVPMQMMDSAFVDDLHQRFPPIRLRDIVDDGHGGYTVDRRAGDARKLARDARKSQKLCWKRSVC
jgi:hypothetical protein